MSWSIHHVNIPAHDVRQSVAFYRDVLGIPEGKWQLPAQGHKGNFNADPDHLALLGENSRGIHIVKPVADFGKNNNLWINPTVGGHFAVTVPDLAAVKKRLEERGIMYTEGGQYAMEGVINLYIYDPSMNIVEVNQIL